MNPILLTVGARLRCAVLLLFCLLASPAMTGFAQITNSVTDSSFCAGASIILNYSSPTALGSGSTISVELSDDSGSFTSASAVGTICSFSNVPTSGSVTITIPSYTPTGNGYRLRVNTQGPTIGTPTSVNLHIVGRLYVDGGASSWGSGGSWASPLKTLDSALRIANAENCGTEIWVKAGTYYPTAGTAITGSRDSSFRIFRSGIKVYGGFAGTESALSQRAIAANPTILSGNIGTPGNAADNSYHVFTILPVNGTATIDTTTVIDGFTIRDGNANAAYNTTFVANGFAISSDGGGGIYMGALAGGTCSPKISNCTISDNKAAGGGGGICLNTSTHPLASARPIIYDCSFINNSAVNAHGGGIYNYGNAGSGNGIGYNIRETLSGCTFLNNTAEYGGAIWSWGSVLSISSSVFNGNSARSVGGALYNDMDTVSIKNCDFKSNSTVFSQGGAMFSSATLGNADHSSFDSNFTTGNGGAVYVNSGNWSFSNCRFIANTATNGDGGAIVQNNPPATLTLTNDTLGFNKAGGSGGAIWSRGPSVVSNCIINDNRAGQTGGGIFAQGVLKITGSVFERDSSASNGGGIYMIPLSGFTAGLRCVGNFFKANYSSGSGAGISVTAPTDTIVNNVFVANKANTVGGAGVNIALTSTDAAFVANNTFYQNTTAGSGALRLSGSSGTFRAYNNLFWANTAPEISNAASGTSFTQLYNYVTSDPQFTNPSNAIGTDNIWGTADDGLQLKFLSTARNAGNNAFAFGFATDVIGSARIQGSAIDAGAYESSASGCPAAARVYVDSSLSVSGDGTSWSQAYKTVWEALTIANACSGVSEIWVKKGTYYPMSDPTTIATSRDSSFRIFRSGIKIYGGFGGNETQLSQRSVAGNPTILSGDIGTKNGNTDNVYHVFTILPLNSTGTIDTNTVIDGFTIRDGYSYANNTLLFNGVSIFRNVGAGIYIGVASGGVCSPQINNCILANNECNKGGALGIYGVSPSSKPIISNSTFRNNTAGSYGGAIYNYGSSLSISFSTFIGNTAPSVYGGGIFNASGSVCNLVNSSFIANKASYGGAVFSDGPLTTKNCVFSENCAASVGGGIYGSARIEITGSVFERDSTNANGGAVCASGTGNLYSVGNFFNSNYALGSGGALSIGAGSDTVVNNVFVANKSGSGGGSGLDVRATANAVSFVANNSIAQNVTTGTGALRISGSAGTVKVYNNLLWGNSAGSGTADINNATSGATVTQSNNYTTPNPQFTNASNPIGTDNIWGTADDGLQISSTSSAVNAGNNAYTAGLTTDITGAARIQGGTVDAGAYESPVAACPDISSTSSTNPTSCAGVDGTISLDGLTAASVYTVNYSLNGSAQTPLTLTSDAGGTVVLTGLAAGSYSNFTVINSAACTSSVYTGPVVLTDPAAPNIGSNTSSGPTTCAGADGTITLKGLTASSTYSVNYSLNGTPQTSLSLSANAGGEIVLVNLSSGSFSNFTVVNSAACTSSVYAGPVLLTDPPAPAFSFSYASNPSGCGATNGTLSLTGLVANSVYTINYSLNGIPQLPWVTTAEVNGRIVVGGLSAGSYSNLSVTSAAGCASSVYAGPIVLNNPAPPAISSASTTIPTTCGGSDGTISLNGLTPSTSHLVNYSLNGTPQSSTIISDAGGVVTISGLNAGSYSNFTVTSSAACTSSVYAGPVVVTDPAPPVISSASTNDPTTCGGADGRILLIGLSASTSYAVNYEMNGSPQTANITSNGGGLLFISGLAAGSYTNISVTGANCSSNVIPGPIVLNPPPTPVITSISSADPTTCGSTGYIILNGLVANRNFTATYSMNGGSPVTVTISSGSTGVALIVGLAPGVYSNISVTKDNCQSNIVGPLTISDPPTPPAPTASSNGPVCQGATLQLSASGITGSHYEWSGPNGYSDTTWNPTVTNNMQSTDTGTYSVTQRVAGCVSPAATVSVAMSTVPAAPGVISGNNAPCVGVAYAYSVSPVATGSSYVWTIPSGSGWGGSSAASSISVTAGASAGNLSVAAVNACGTGASATVTLSPNSSPSTPTVVNGQTTICNGSTAYYYVPVVSNATSYTWNLPTGWTGTGFPTASIFATSGATSGTISVTADNVCGSSAAATLPVTVISVPTQPGAISGSVAPCVNSSQSYSVAAVSGATSYNWSYPSGGNPAWIGGSTNSSINLTVGANSGSINVAALNQCGSSAVTSLLVTVTQLPGLPGAITGKTAPCEGALETYWLSGTSAGASSYNWSVPTTWTGTSMRDTVDIWVGAGSGTITVTPVNACGSGIPRTFAVSGTPVVTTAVSLSRSTPTDTICANTPVTFTATAIGEGTSPQYVFKKNGIIVNSNGNSYTDGKLSGSDVISVTMISSLPCVTQTQVKDSIRMFVIPLVTPGVNINTTPPIILCAGTTVTFVTNTVNAGPVPVYDWYKNGVPLGVTAPTYTTSALANGDTIQVMMTTSAVCPAYPTAVSNKVGLNVNNMVTPSVAISASPAGPYAPGTPVVFSLTESGGGSGATYQWTKNGVNIPFETGETYSTSSLKSGDHIAVRMLSSLPCASPALATSNTIIIQGNSTGVGNTVASTWDGSVELYPNPSSGRFTLAVQWAEAHNSTRVTVDIVSTLGQRIHHLVLHPDRSKWSTDVVLGEEVANGNYILRLVTEDGMSYVRQVMIVR